MSRLFIEFIDETYEVIAPESLTFGRDADLVVDESNVYMHRCVGSFVWHREAWWVRNQSRHADIEVVARSGKRAIIPPGQSEILDGPGTVRFDAGASSYELEHRPELDLGIDNVPPEPPAVVPAELTRDFGRVNLNHEQRAMLVILCTPKLRNPAATPSDIPANAIVANELGWSLRKFDRKLDYLCRRLADEGVRGVRGRKGVEASDRRAVLVDHMIASGQISLHDLDD